MWLAGRRLTRRGRKRHRRPLADQLEQPGHRGRQFGIGGRRGPLVLPQVDVLARDGFERRRFPHARHYTKRSRPLPRPRCIAASAVDATQHLRCGRAGEAC
jgi:hypothetical protein